MTAGRSLLLIAIAASAMSPLAVVGVDAPNTSPTSAPAVNAPLIDSVSKAPNPSAAVEAYARANAQPHDQIALQEAYVRKMVEFGMPDLAELQAQNLMEKAPEQALPWAVTAYTAASRGEPTVALANLETALRKDPDDPFILRTAAQAMAWYDGEADKSKFSDATKSNVDFIRNQTKSYVLYNDAYREAIDARRTGAAPAGPTTQPGPPVDVTPTTTDYPPVESTGPQIVETYGPRIYSDPYVYSYDRYVYSPGVIIYPNHSSHRNHDDHHGHDRDHGTKSWGSRDSGSRSPAVDRNPPVTRTPDPPRITAPAKPEVGKAYFQPRQGPNVVRSTPGAQGPERAPSAAKTSSAVKSSSGKSSSPAVKSSGGSSKSSGSSAKSSSKSDSSSSSAKTSGSRTSSKSK